MRRLAVLILVLDIRAGRADGHTQTTRGPRWGPIRARASRWLGAAALLFLLGAVWCDAANAASDAHAPFGGAAPVPGLNVALSTNLSTYPPGALHVLSASASSTTAVTGDVYVVIQLPSGEFVSLRASGGFSFGLVPFLSSVSVPAGFSFPMQPIFSVSLPVLPFGTYTWFAAFTEVGTLNLLSNLAQAPWVLAQASSSTPVVWVPDFLGAKVQVRTGEGVNTKAVTLLLDPNNVTPCSPNSVAVNGGKLYVVCNGPDAIRVYDANAIKAASSGAVLASQPIEKTITDADFGELIGIAFDGQNNLWVASFAGNTILEVPAANLATANPAVTNRLPNSPDSPVALAFDTDGSLWVAGQFSTGIVLNFPADQLGLGGAAVPRYCISNNIGGCSPQAGLFKSVEGLALFNGKIWVANNGGNAPGQELVPLRVEIGALVADPVFSGAVMCPGGLFATSQHLWVNDQGFNDPGTDCGSTMADQGSGVGAVLRFTQPQLDNHTTDPAQIVRFSNITSRPGFGGIFVEGE